MASEFPLRIILFSFSSKDTYFLLHHFRLLFPIAHSQKQQLFCPFDIRHDEASRKSCWLLLSSIVSTTLRVINSMLILMFPKAIVFTFFKCNPTNSRVPFFNSLQSWEKSIFAVHRSRLLCLKDPRFLLVFSSFFQSKVKTKTFIPLHLWSFQLFF